MNNAVTILFFDCGQPGGTLPPSYDLDADDASAIVGGVDYALAFHIAAVAAELTVHYALMAQGDADQGDHFEATRSRRRADEWLTCHEEANAALGAIYYARLN